MGIPVRVVLFKPQSHCQVLLGINTFCNRSKAAKYGA
jgi:hypothetical protein